MGELVFSFCPSKISASHSSELTSIPDAAVENAAVSDESTFARPKSCSGPV